MSLLIQIAGVLPHGRRLGLALLCRCLPVLPEQGKRISLEINLDRTRQVHEATAEVRLDKLGQQVRGRNGARDVVKQLGALEVVENELPVRLRDGLPVHLGHVVDGGEQEILELFIGSEPVELVIVLQIQLAQQGAQVLDVRARVE